MLNRQKNIVACLETGQITCHNSSGRIIDCTGSGQDAEFRKGVSWPSQRFEVHDHTVTDQLTGLVWAKNANMAEFPLAWEEAIGYVAAMNRDHAFGFSDWRLPNRRELRSLMSHQTRKPALPDIPLPTSSADGTGRPPPPPSIPLLRGIFIWKGARMFYGHKEQFFMVWPVRGKGNNILPATGQTECYDATGERISCTGSGQDGAFRSGSPWPEPRFEAAESGFLDRLTNLCWHGSADLSGRLSTWEEAFETVAELNRGHGGTAPWRLPNINELESLVDCSTHSPALPHGHPFRDVGEGYWSSTTSLFEPDWAWALYLTKGAVGVGQKKDEHFSVWAVCDSLT